MAFKIRSSKYRHIFCDAPKPEVRSLKVGFGLSGQGVSKMRVEPVHGLRRNGQCIYVLDGIWFGGNGQVLPSYSLCSGGAWRYPCSVVGLCVFAFFTQKHALYLYLGPSIFKSSLFIPPSNPNLRTFLLSPQLLRNVSPASSCRP